MCSFRRVWSATQHRSIEFIHHCLCRHFFRLIFGRIEEVADSVRQPLGVCISGMVLLSMLNIENILVERSHEV